MTSPRAKTFFKNRSKMAYLVDPGVLYGAVDGTVMHFCAQTTQARDP